jgi:predicted lipoprotein with Yx(FWY)xxD motif
MAIDKIQSESINLADNFAFTGTVTGASGVNTPAFHAGGSAAVSIANSTQVLLTFDTEVLDSDNCFDTSTNKFTPTTAGKYFIYAAYRLNTTSGGNFQQAIIEKNGSTIFTYNKYHSHKGSVQISGIADANGSSDYFQAFGYHQIGSTVSTYGDVATLFFGAYKIIT